MESDDRLSELNDAARQAGYIVTEQIDLIIARAEGQAETILRDAERDAEDTRREAIESAKRLLDRLHALEFPLGELVGSLRDEVEQVSLEVGRRKHVDSDATSLPPAPEGEHDETGEGEAAFELEGEPTPEEAPVAADAPAAEDSDQPAEEPPLEPTEPDAPAENASARKPRRNRGRDRRRQKAKQAKGHFITSEGSCAVCDRTFQAADERELEQSGWRVTGDVGLCPECQADDWQLADGARLPVRPGGRR